MSNSEFRIENSELGNRKHQRIIMKRIILLFLLVSLSLSKAHAQAADLFQKANAAYAEGNYEAAVEAYEEILAGGQTAAGLHYNLANAHYKLNHIAPSIYHYEKALQLDPTDSDIRNNLQFAQNMTVDAIEAAPQDSFSRWWQSFLGSFSTTGWATLGIICMALFVLLFLAYHFSGIPLRKRIFLLSGMFFLFLALSSVSLGFIRAENLRNQNFAVVFAEEIGISSEPNERGEELFFLHEGTKVELLEDFQEWVKIELANGNQGWIRREAIKIL